MLNRFGHPLLLAACVLALQSGALAAQSDAQSGGLDPNEAIKAAKQVYGPPPPRRNCNKKGSDEEIVVCAQEDQDDSQYRVKSTSELDPNSKEALNDGKPRAPDVSGDGIFKGKATVGGLCVMGGCPPPPAYIFDLSALPEAPAGSDADKIAKGEKPAD